MALVARIIGAIFKPTQGSIDNNNSFGFLMILMNLKERLKNI
jgi:hypothetical protein